MVDEEKELPIFTTGQAAKLTGVDQRRVAQYLHKMQVIPSVESKGQGRAASLSILDVLKIDILARLSDCGVAARVAGKIAANAVPYAGSKDKYKHDFDPGLCLQIDLKECRERIFHDIKGGKFEQLAVANALTD